MPSPDDSRRDYLTLLAVEPKDGTTTYEIQVSYDRMQTVARRSMGHAKECAFIVPQILQKPTAIFEGLRRDEDEDRWGYGWRCYCGVPDQRFRQDGTSAHPYPGQVYLVFVNDEAEVVMTTMSNSDFAKRLMLLARPADQFEPIATYDPDGDCIEFLVKPDPFYAERVDDLVMVDYSQETDEVIGSLIKGVSRFCSKLLETMPGFQIEIHDGRVRLVHIFRARLWTSKTDPSDLVTLTYKKLIQVAEEADIEAQMCLAGS